MAHICSLILPAAEPSDPFILVTGPSISNTLVAVSTPGAQPLAASHCHEEEPGLLENIADPGLGQQCSRMSPCRKVRGLETNLTAGQWGIKQDSFPFPSNSVVSYFLMLL